MFDYDLNPIAKQFQFFLLSSPSSQQHLLFIQIMRQKIRIAFYIRIIIVILIAPGIYLLINNLLQHNNDDEISNIFDDNNDIVIAKNSHIQRRVLNNIVDGEITSLNQPTDNTSFYNKHYNKAIHMILHGLVASYIFWMLAIICDEYFIKAIEILCQKLKLKEDIAGAIFLSMATSGPELLINCISTLNSNGNIGVGTIVGTSVFNSLAIPALCGFFSCASIQLDWWSISRDCSFYCLSVIALIAVIYDSQIIWYEAVFLVCCYGVYLIVMYKNDSMSVKAKALAHEICDRIYRQQPTTTNSSLPYHDLTEISPLLSTTIKKTDFGACQMQQDEQHVVMVDLNEKIDEFIHHQNHENEGEVDENVDEFTINPWTDSFSKGAIYWLRWPIDILLYTTIPDPRRHKSLYMLTFINCIIWIGICSYLIVYVTTDVDSVMGMAFLAVGTSLPDAVSSVIVTCQGYGSMGVSYSIASNIFDILLCLGLPWLIKTLIAPAFTGQPMMLVLQSTDTKYFAISLMTTLFALYYAFITNKFVLDKRIGYSCMIFYLLFLIFASFVDFNVFFPLNARISDY